MTADEFVRDYLSPWIGHDPRITAVEQVDPPHLSEITTWVMTYRGQRIAITVEPLELVDNPGDFDGDAERFAPLDTREDPDPFPDAT